VDNGYLRLRFNPRVTSFLVAKVATKICDHGMGETITAVMSAGRSGGWGGNG